jgi:small-conductance mechanosensitive channel
VNKDVVDLLTQGSRFALLTSGAVTALGTMGIDISALVAGLGLTGFALGFALRDALSNFLAGILLLVYQPFERGDRVTVAGQTGTVIDIDLRYMTLQSEGTRILVPNSTAFNNVVVVETQGA